jgi:hypothetical protein
VDPHEAEPEAAVLFPRLGDLGVGELGAEGAAYEELGGQLNDGAELRERFDAPKVK